ncbi:MAG: biotin--[acetyl-CoA-carboxylase] ligase [Paracoccaceae bacterium]
MARHVLAEVDSTNALALRLAPDLTGPAWFLAQTQSAGRGRRARPWASPAGNFHASLLCFPGGPAAAVALWSFAISLALWEALAALTGQGPRLALKWPNDVLLDGAKVAGILLESSGTGARIEHLAIGVGVNLIAAPPAETLEPGALPAASVLGQTGQTITPAALLDALAPAYARWEAVLERQGFAPLREAWLARAARLGEPITARTAKAVHRGRFETIDLHGHLILHTASGRLSIPAADVFF